MLFDQFDDIFEMNMTHPSMPQPTLIYHSKETLFILDIVQYVDVIQGPCSYIYHVT